jgi:hypothetical protein
MGHVSDLSDSSHDGSRPSKAILVASIAEELAWMQQHYPGFQPGLQVLQQIDGKQVDVLTWSNDRGEKRTVYFDISEFYGKRRKPTPS